MKIGNVAKRSLFLVDLGIAARIGRGVGIGIRNYLEIIGFSRRTRVIKMITVAFNRDTGSCFFNKDHLILIAAIWRSVKWP